MIKFKQMSRTWVLVPAIVAAIFLGACGGGGSGGGTGNDEDYVAAICKAAVRFEEDLVKVMREVGTSDDEDEAAKAMAAPFKEFAASVKKAKPPADLKSWHDEMAAELEKAANALEKGNFDALGDDPFSDPPSNVSERLEAVAQKNADCNKSSLFGQ